MTTTLIFWIPRVVYHNMSLRGMYYDILAKSKKLLVYNYTILVDYFSFVVFLILEN
jgi:hypothetical protein